MGGLGRVSALKEKVFAVFEKGEGETNLSALCLDLLAEQKIIWPACKRGLESIHRAERRSIQCRGFSVIVQHNPGRLVSTTAKVNKEAISTRPCFLCSSHLPDHQKAIAYRNAYLILCNPMPIFPMHFTVASIRHQPQTIGKNLPAFLALALDAGPGWLALYNGPQCGASAPDHLHFQLVPAGCMPIEEEILERSRLTHMKQFGAIEVCFANKLGREAILFEGDDSGRLTAVLRSFLRNLAIEPTSVPEAIEPMVNMICYSGGGKQHVIVFPRKKHRPEGYYKSGTGRLIISPAVAEMGGLIITPIRADFDRIDGGVVEGIYEEVSLTRGFAESVISRMM
jgi:hypothetical protein